MRRGIFDPGSGETERSGSYFAPADADQYSQLSHLRTDVAEGAVGVGQLDETVVAELGEAADAARYEQRIAAAHGLPPEDGEIVVNEEPADEQIADVVLSEEVDLKTVR